MKVENWIEIGAVVVTLSGVAASALFSYWSYQEAKNTGMIAHILERRKFETETSMKMLEAAVSKISSTMADPTPGDEAAAQVWLLRKAENAASDSAQCILIGTLIAAERDALTLTSTEEGAPTPPQYVLRFAEAISFTRAWSPNCLMLASQASGGVLLPIAQAAPNGPAPADAASRPASIQQAPWQAIIASYSATQFMCDRFAKKDVAYFSEQLPGEYKGRMVRVSKAPNNLYVVSVDAGDDQGLANSLVSAIRNVAPRDGTGKDAFVGRAFGWGEAPNCQAIAPID